jgi:hypothetical protein
MAGRPRINPANLVHTTRVRASHQILTNKELDSDIEMARKLLAQAEGVTVAQMNISRTFRTLLANYLDPFKQVAQEAAEGHE